MAAPLLEAARAAGLPDADTAWLERAVATDAAAWREEFGTAKDVSGLAAERNVFRYRPVPVTVRYEAETSGHGLAELLRVAAAGLRAWSGIQGSGIQGSGAQGTGAHLTVSSAVGLPAAVAAALEKAGAAVRIEDADQWARRARGLADRTGPESAARIRLVGGSVSATAAATGESLTSPSTPATWSPPAGWSC